MLNRTFKILVGRMSCIHVDGIIRYSSAAQSGLSLYENLSADSAQLLPVQQPVQARVSAQKRGFGLAPIRIHR